MFFRLLLYMPMMFGAGIATFFLTNYKIPISVLLNISAIIALITIARKKDNYSILLILSISFILGYSNIIWKESLTPEPLYKSFYSLPIQATITNIELYPSAQRIMLSNLKVLNKNWKNFPSNVRIKVNGLKYNFQIGDVIQTRVNLLPPPSPVYPQGYDFATKAKFQKIQAVGYNISKIKIIENIKSKNVSLLEKFTIFMADVRKSISDKIRSALPKNENRVALSLVTGEQNSIPTKTLQNYRDSGLVHILSVSGMHMSVLAFLVFAICRAGLALIPIIALKYNVKKISAVIALIIAFLYLMISGEAIPAQRAFIMVAVVFIAILADRKAISLRTVAVAAMIIMIISPQSVLNIGFQMSFAAVAALVVFYEKSYLPKSKNITSMFFAYVYSVLVSAFIGTIATAPYAIYYFNRFPIYSVFSNLLVSAIFGVIIMPFLLLALLLMPFGGEFYPLQVAGIGISSMNDIAEWITSLPYAVILFPQISLWALIALSIGLYLFVLSNTKYWKYIYLIPILPIIISIITYQKPDFIINDNSSLVAVNHNNTLLFSGETGNKMQKNVWASMNAQVYNKKAQQNANEYFNKICKINKCSFKIENLRFDFAFDKKIKNKTLKIYKNNTLYQEFNKNILKVNKTMLFYVRNDKLIIRTVK